MKKIIVWAWIVLFLISCGGSEQNREERLYKNVMSVHDEVMPQLGQIMQLEKNINDEISHLQAEDTLGSKKPRIEYLNALKTNLRGADESMMNWMREFNNDMTDMSHEEKMQYLETEKQKIEQVKEQVNTAIQSAKEAVGR